MNTSPVSADDIRAAAAAHHELGPEYSDAAVAAFLERVDRAVAARVEARLATMRQEAMRRSNRRTLLTALAVGACTGALATGLAVASVNSGSAAPVQSQVVPHVRLLPVYEPGNAIVPPKPPQPSGG